VGGIFHFNILMGNQLGQLVHVSFKVRAHTKSLWGNNTYPFAMFIDPFVTEVVIPHEATFCCFVGDMNWLQIPLLTKSN